MEVVRRRLRVAGVADEADDGARLDLVAVDGERRERGEMRVVELVALPVAQPEPVAAEVVPADGEDGAVGDRQQRRAERREDVLAVMPADAGARAAEGVDERGRPVDGEDVAGGRERRRDVGRRQPEDRSGPVREPPARAASAAASASSRARRAARPGFAVVVVAACVAAGSSTGVDAAASAWPTRISVPVGRPA